MNELTRNHQNASFCQNFPFKLKPFFFFENSRILRKLKQYTQFSAFPKPVNVRQVAKKRLDYTVRRFHFTTCVGLADYVKGLFREAEGALP